MYNKTSILSRISRLLETEDDDSTRTSTQTRQQEAPAPLIGEISRKLPEITPEVLDKVWDKVGKPARTLGEGSYGVAVLMTDGSVLKFTQDRDEAATASYILKQRLRHPNLINIHGVWQITNDVYLVHMDLVEEVPTGIKTELTRIYKEIRRQDERFKSRPTWEMTDFLIAAYKKHPDKHIQELAGFLEDMKKHGIYLPDVKGSNVGMQNGHVVVFDPGVSRAPTSGSIRKLESLNRTFGSLADFLGVD